MKKILILLIGASTIVSCQQEQFKDSVDNGIKGSSIQTPEDRIVESPYSIEEQF